MTNVEKFQGILPAFYACYEDNGEVSKERSKALVRYFIEAGVQGLYVNGSSGECIYLSVEDRKQILEAVMAEAKGKLRIIAHVACNNTKDSVELAKHAESLGVDAIASIPPFTSVCRTTVLRSTGTISVQQHPIQTLSFTIFLSLRE